MEVGGALRFDDFKLGRLVHSIILYFFCIYMHQYQNVVNKTQHITKNCTRILKLLQYLFGIRSGTDFLDCRFT